MTVTKEISVHAALAAVLPFFYWTAFSHEKNDIKTELNRTDGHVKYST